MSEVGDADAWALIVDISSEAGPVVGAIDVAGSTKPSSSVTPPPMDVTVPAVISRVPNSSTTPHSSAA